MRSLAFFLFLLSSIALANAPGYDLSLGAEARDGTLKVAPIVMAPPGANLHYEVTTTRTGRSGNSNSRQSGNVTVGDDGKASLSRVSVSLSEQDRYEVQVEVYDRGRLVATETLRHPD
jgi:hypothetical protein